MGKSLCDTCLVKLGKRDRRTVEKEVCDQGKEIECPDYAPEVNEFLRRMNLVFKSPEAKELVKTMQLGRRRKDKK